jgi:hypothetical protein
MSTMHRTKTIDIFRSPIIAERRLRVRGHLRSVMTSSTHDGATIIIVKFFILTDLA